MDGHWGATYQAAVARRERIGAGQDHSPRERLRSSINSLVPPVLQ
ncbi:hypothetical protein DB30_05457 [Enhygromyxa salina]|uniref:Uncharacterized protein n=1 Tax=Enhygromyxa salina TaxID=215803 RepID=A0A0C1ZWZ6_9BACT|nr:hypothetical protein DB30_05457 [Enhygromyxa salina]